MWWHRRHQTVKKWINSIFYEYFLRFLQEGEKKSLKEKMQAMQDITLQV